MKRKLSKTSLNDKHELLNSSLFHYGMREILINDIPFKGMNCYQEVPLSFFVEDYYGNELFVDWYIEPIKCCVELHGEQHYVATSFGNQSAIDKDFNFINIKQRDFKKEQLLLDNGYIYISIPYEVFKKEQLNKDYLIKRIKDAYNK